MDKNENKDDTLTTLSKSEIAKCRNLPEYPWHNEFERWGFENEHGELYGELRKYWVPRLKYTYDPYWENFDQAGIGMQATIITDGFYKTPSNKIILDVGAGRGDLMVYLSRFGNKIIGLDAGLAAQKLYYDEKRYEYCTLLYMDVSRDRFPFPDNVFDIVFFTETVEHLSDPMHACMEIKRVLKENGELVVTFPEAEDQKGYWRGNHSFVYPGLFYRKNFRRFMIQLFFKQIKYAKNGDTGKYIFKNIKEGFINPVAMAKGDWQGNLVYKDIRMPNEDMEKEWKDFTIQDMYDMNTAQEKIDFMRISNED